MSTTDRDPLLYRDGTAQSQRLPKAMSLGYIAVEERTITDAFAFIQSYAKELQFYDLEDTPIGDWSTFFNQDIDDIIAFIQDPKIFADDKDKELQLSQPHLVLLLTFLQLLEHQKKQTNTLTKKHLDFYHQQALQMTKKAAIPDQVHVTIQLDSRNSTYELRAGTLFYAGRDSEGNDLLYESQTDTLINQASISQLKTLYNDKQTVTLRDSELREGDIVELVELAVGDPNPGDPLPPFPPGIDSLNDILLQWDDIDEGIIDDAMEEAIVDLMRDSIFIAQEYQVNTFFKAVLNETLTDNLKPHLLGDQWEMISPRWRHTIARTIDNPTERGFGEAMLAALYPEPDAVIPEISARNLGRDLLLIMEKSPDVLFDLILETLQYILTADIDEETKGKLIAAIDNAVAGTGNVIEYIDTDEKAILNRILNEAISKAEAKSNENPLAESVATALYTDSLVVNQDRFTQAATYVLGESTKKAINEAIRIAINEQAVLMQEAKVNDVLEDNPDIETAISDSNDNDPEEIADDLITDSTDDILNDATGGLLTDETRDLISLAVQLSVEEITLKTIGRQGIADATQTALEGMLSQELIDNVSENIQLGIIMEKVTAMSAIGDQRREAVKEIIEGSLAKVTQQTLTGPVENRLTTEIIRAVDGAENAVESAVSKVTDVTVSAEAQIYTNDALLEVITIAKDTAESAAEDYCYEQLYMTQEELDYVLQDRLTTDDESWEKCYVILEDAHEDKVIAEGEEVLKDKREEGDKITAGRGFQDISEYCWGQPTEENPLPPYPEGANNLDDVYDQWQNGTEEEKEEASDYIRYELFLTEDDFSYVIETKNDPRASGSDWNEVYTLMEVARIETREIVIPEPQKDVYGNFYASPDVTQTAFKTEYEDETSDPHWDTFGTNKLDEENGTVVFADIGFGISSSVLAMEKGRRSITWTMDFEPESYDEDDMELLFADGNTSSNSEEFPFTFYISTVEEWIEIRVDHVRYGTCITRDPEKPYAIAGVSLSPSNIVTKEGGQGFTSADVGGFLVWGAEATTGSYVAAGAIYQIDSVVNSNEVKVTPLSVTMPADQQPEEYLVKKYGPEDIYFQALQFELSMDEKEDPIAVPEDDSTTFQWPVLKMLLRNIYQDSGIQGVPGSYTNGYNQIENLKLARACVKVKVEELNEFTLSNDEAILKSNSPFEPFGSNPEAGSALYFAHTETAYKKLDTLQMEIEWMGAPDDFKSYYENYWRVDGLKDYPYVDNAGYTAQLKLNDRSLALPLQSFEYTETLLVREESSDEEAFLLSGTPSETVTIADIKAKAEDGRDLPVIAYNPEVTSQYIVISTEGRSIGDTFTVTYGENTVDLPTTDIILTQEEPLDDSEPLTVHKIGDRVTFYLKYGMDDDNPRNIQNHVVTWDSSEDVSIIRDSGTYLAAEVTVNTLSLFEEEGDKVEITYPVTGDPYLFSSSDATSTHKLCIRNISEVLQASSGTYEYSRDNSLYTDEDIREWARYWELSLNQPNFYHADYNRLLSKQQSEGYQDVKTLLLNPPYTPNIKRMTFAYTALATVETKVYDTDRDDDLLLYVHPFGYSQIYPSEETSETEETDEKKETQYSFFPEYQDEGHLYIGFEGLETPNSLSVLFQMAEASADPDLPTVEVQWSYLSNNLWVELGEERIPSDDTNGLLNTGIISFDLPEDATSDNTTLPGGFHWLRASVNRYTDAICDTISIEAQAVNAVLTNVDEVPPDHFEEPLPTGSITRTSEQIEEIETVNQPYTSEKGKPEERDMDFYIRVGERIRHKNRAVTLWDYERLVLEKFPDVYKAKCLFINDKTNIEAELGKVEVIVVPDIKGKLPFNPFEPKVSASQILEIQQYLDERRAEAVSLEVRNAEFIPIKLRFAVRFLEGYNEGVYQEQLNEDLKQYLSPGLMMKGQK